MLTSSLSLIALLTAHRWRHCAIGGLWSAFAAFVAFHMQRVSTLAAYLKKAAAARMWVAKTKP